MIDSLLEATPEILSPERLSLVFLGVCIGALIGVLPGLGGTVGMAILLPFVFGMDPYSAIALMIGMKVITNTSDTFPAVLLGIPGSSGPQATIMDGYPMAKNGEAARALGAGFASSLLGGLFGAAFLLLIIPVARPLVLALGTPELFMVTLLGVAMVGVLSRSAPVIGVLSGLFGLLLATVGAAPGLPVYRYTFDITYLTTGIPIAVFALGFFALPEIIDLVTRRSRISSPETFTLAQFKGVRDAFRNWWLIIRSSLLGSATGLVPGFGGGSADWLAYGVAKQTSKGGYESFGKGDVRGVIAPESTNNAKDGADLVPTLMFGIPGGGSMAIFLAGLLILGVQPGPGMVDPERDLPFTLAIIWTFAIGNIVGTVLCFTLSRYIARLSIIPATKFMPFLVVVVFIAAYQSTRHWGDVILLLTFGVIGYIMKRLSWPRIPLLIGFILSTPAERYLFISNEVYEGEWLMRPGVLIIAALIAVIVIGTTVSGGRNRRRVRLRRERVEHGN